MCQLQTGTCPEQLPVTEKQGCLPSSSVETEPCAVAVADPQPHLRGVRVESEALCAPESLANRPSDSKIFPGTDFMVPILACLHI